MGFNVRRLALAPHKMDFVDSVDAVDFVEARNAEPADRYLAEIPTSGMLFFGMEPLSAGTSLARISIRACAIAAAAITV